MNYNTFKANQIKWWPPKRTKQWWNEIYSILTRHWIIADCNRYHSTLLKPPDKPTHPFIALVTEVNGTRLLKHRWNDPMFPLSRFLTMRRIKFPAHKDKNNTNITCASFNRNLNCSYINIINERTPVLCLFRVWVESHVRSGWFD